MNGDKKELNLEIGKRIRMAREQVGYAREKLAEYVDITPRFVADIERGSVGISVQTLKKICEVLNISSDSILWNKTTDTNIDAKLKFLDSKYIDTINKTVQCQIELIMLAEDKL